MTAPSASGLRNECINHFAKLAVRPWQRTHLTRMNLELYSDTCMEFIPHNYVCYGFCRNANTLSFILTFAENPYKSYGFPSSAFRSNRIGHSMLPMSHISLFRGHPLHLWQLWQRWLGLSPEHDVLAYCLNDFCQCSTLQQASARRDGLVTVGCTFSTRLLIEAPACFDSLP